MTHSEIFDRTEIDWCQRLGNVRNLCLPIVIGILPGTWLFAQAAVDTGVVAPQVGLRIPTLNEVRTIESAPKVSPHSDILKHLTIESFGVGLSYRGQGLESSPRLSSGPLTPEGFECPRCLIRPPMDRYRSTLPPFGAQLTLRLWSDRAQIFGRFGGVNAWKPDHTIIDAHRGSSFNDAWLIQSVFGARVALDRNKHIWLGMEVGYFKSLGADQRRWHSERVTATYLFGH